MAAADRTGIAHLHTDDLAVATPVPPTELGACRRGARDLAARQGTMRHESARLRYHDDDLLTVAEAAREARRSVRTLRRAYRSGS
jgi:hypothetical protein